MTAKALPTPRREQGLRGSHVLGMILAFFGAIFLINGVKLTGVVTSFDNFCVLLRRDSHSQLVYKHAISTIMPGQPLQMFESEENAS